MTLFRVLHVDDEPDIREVVKFSLALDPDIVTLSCSSGEEALVAAEACKPDMVLLDVMMPVMDGAATLARLRQNPATASIPVVFMTARAQSRELDLFRSLGAIGVIAKPFDPMKLAASVRAHVEPSDVRLSELRADFVRRIEGDLVALTAHWSSLEDGSALPCSLAEIRGIAHGLAGAGGIFGFDELSAAAATLEEAIVEYDGVGTIGAVGLALERVFASVEPQHRRRNIVTDRMQK